MADSRDPYAGESPAERKERAGRLWVIAAAIAILVMVSLGLIFITTGL